MGLTKMLFFLLLLALFCNSSPIGDDNKHSLNFLSVRVSHSIAQDGTAWAMLSMDTGNVNYGDLLNVTFKRVMRESADIRKEDFLGLYFLGDDRVDSPWNWEWINPSSENGTIVIEANKAGEMEIRLVRPPNLILARLRVNVFQPCAPSCYAHGACIKGQCMCQPAYSLPVCASLASDGVTLEAFDTQMTKQMQTKLPIVVVITDTFPFQLDGNDYIGIYPVPSPDGLEKAVSWKYALSKNVSTSVEIEVKGVKVAGIYVARLMRTVDGAIIAQSNNFTVFEYCPHQCTGHGVCISGQCQCFSNWSSTDCSVGPGLVNLTASNGWSNQSSPDFVLKRNSEVTVKFSRLYNSEFPLLISNADWIGLFDAMDNSSDPFAYQYAQVPIDEMSQSGVQTGEVTFIIPPYKSISYYEFKYVRNDHAVISTTGPLEVFRPCSPQNCSGNGECSKGECICLAGWKGTGCEVGDVDTTLVFDNSNVLYGKSLNITFIRGVNDGSVSDYVGLYGQFSANNDDQLFGWAITGSGNVSKTSPNTVEGAISIIPNEIGFYKLRYVNAFTKSTVFESSLFQIWNSCPDDCANHGNCVHGVCTCQVGWLLPNCKRIDAKLIMTPPAKVLLSQDYFSKTSFSVTVDIPEGWYSPGNFIGLYPVPKNSLNPISTTTSLIVQQISPSVLGSSSVTFQVSSSLAPGNYQLLYVSGLDYTQLAQSVPFQIVPDCNTGSYDLTKNICICPETKTGDRCEADTCCFELSPSATRGHPEDKISVTWIRPNKNGVDSDLIGLYFSNATEYLTPYAYAFADGQGKDNGVVQLTLPNLEETYTVHYISSISMTSKSTGPNIYVTIPCDPQDCNGNGVCIGGKCVCSNGYGGEKCDKSIPSTASLTLDNSGTVPAGSLITIKWKRTATLGESGDYIGIYKRLDNLTPYAYAYVDLSSGAYEGVIQINAPSIPATYQARWYSAKKRTALITSAEFDVTL